MTAEKNQTHGWTEGRAKRASSDEKAWIAALVCRIVAQELNDAIKPLVKRLDEVERRQDARLSLPQRAYSEAKE